MISLKDDEMFKLGIRSQLNTIYSLSKLLVVLLDKTDRSYNSAKVMQAVADAITGQSDCLLCNMSKHIQEQYGDKV